MSASSTPPPTVFLDMDGVLVDLDKLPLEYQRLLGEVLAPELEGSVEDWGRANAVSFPRWFAYVGSLPPDEHPNARLDREAVLSVRGMCEILGIPAPPEEDCIRLGRAVDTYVRTHHEAFYPGVAEVISAIAETHDVHFATGNVSAHVEITVERLVLGGRIGLPCGPDLVGVLKASPRFYPLLFDLAEVDPSDTIVVDDTPAQLAMAAEHGARTVLVGVQSAGTAHVDAAISSIHALPQVLQALARSP